MSRVNGNVTSRRLGFFFYIRLSGLSVPDLLLRVLLLLFWVFDSSTLFGLLEQFLHLA